MTPEQQRIKIAESQDIININTKCWRGHLNGYEVKIPDYCNDLNAMHEAEKVLTSGQCAKYRDYLDQNTAVYEDMQGACIDWNLVHATASQRAEAFCAVLGLDK